MKAMLLTTNDIAATAHLKVTQMSVQHRIYIKLIRT